MGDKNYAVLISVIIPVFNRENYIARCLKSILNQTYENLEIIVVDDGSEDKSAEVCEEFAAMDSRIKVIKKLNEGSGFARNAGIDVARGEYFFFVDSDDYLTDNCLERLLEVAELEKADLVECNYAKGKEQNFSLVQKKKVYQKYTNVSAFESRDINIAIWGKLIKKNIFDGIRYPKVTLFDDEFFTYKVIYKSKNIVYLDEIYYYVYMSSKSIMREEKKNVPVSILEAYNQRICYFSNLREEKLEGISHKELAIRLMLILLQIRKYENGKESKDELIKQFINEYCLGAKYALFGKESISLSCFYIYLKIVSMICGK